MVTVVQSVLLACVAAVVISHSTASVVKRQASFTCPKENGAFEYKDDCSKFWQCDGGVPSLVDCQPQLLFNRDSGYCDWPFRVKGSTCARLQNKAILTANVSTICQADPNGGNPENAFVVSHPKMCNAFYTCSGGFLFAPCTFCPEGMVFSQGLGGCQDARGMNRDALCQGREFVEHKDKVFRIIDGSCWPFNNIPNPYQELADRIKSGGAKRN